MDWEAEDSPEIVPATGKPLNVTRHHGRLPITEDENPFTLNMQYLVNLNAWLLSPQILSHCSSTPCASTERESSVQSVLSELGK